MKKLTSAVVMLTGILFLAGCDINKIPTLDEAVKAQWAQVQNQYQRRADLIPNLVEVVKGFATQEREVLTAVTEARAKATQMTLPSDVLTNPQAFQAFQQNQGALTSALARLMVVVERYPELKSDRNFLELQAQLEGTENRIAVARRDYIQSVQEYNTEIRTFPGRLWAMTLYSDAEIKASFEAVNPDAAATAPKVDFK